MANNKAVQVHPVILWWMSRNWNIEVVSADHGSILWLFTEYWQQGTGFEHTYRAHPDYHGDGPWYDWTMVKFENFGDYPA
jgi:hypothetical protein